MLESKEICRIRQSLMLLGGGGGGGCQGCFVGGCWQGGVGVF
jgi:hypothetical protein